MSDPGIIYLLNQVMKKLKKEIEAVKNQTKKDTLSVINALHVLKRILEMSVSKEEALRIMIKDTIWGVIDNFEILLENNIED